MNLAEAVEFTFTNRESWANGAGAGTNRINSNHFLRILGEKMEADAVRPMHFTQIQQKLKEEGKANGTINRVCAALSTVLNELYLNDLVDRKATYRRLKEKRGRAGFYTLEEIEHMIACCGVLDPSEQDLMRDSIEFSYKLGNRQGELLELMWEHVDLEAQTVTFVDTKNGEDHTLPIKGEVYDMLKRRYDERIDDGAVFPWTDKHMLLRRFRRVQQAAGIDKNRCWHHLRHSTGTHLVSQGVPLRTVMGVLNHKNVNTTLRYAKNTEKAISDALELL